MDNNTRQLLEKAKDRLERYVEAVSYVDSTYIAPASLRTGYEYDGPQVPKTETEELMAEIEQALQEG